MNLTCKTISSRLYGEVRIVSIDDLFPVYCATDVARLFGFRDPRGAVKNHCKSTGKLRYEGKRGVRRMNFISIADVKRLCKASSDPFSAETCNWLLNNVPAENDKVYEVDTAEEEEKQKPDVLRNIVVRRPDMLELYDALTLMEDMLKIISEYVSDLIVEG